MYEVIIHSNPLYWQILILMLRVHVNMMKKLCVTHCFTICCYWLPIGWNQRIFTPKHQPLWQYFLIGLRVTIPWTRRRPDRSCHLLSWKMSNGSCRRCCKTRSRLIVCVFVLLTFMRWGINISFMALLSQHVLSASVYADISSRAYVAFVCFLRFSQWFCHCICSADGMSICRSDSVLIKAHTFATWK